MPLVRFGWDDQPVKFNIDTSDINEGKRLTFIMEQDDLLFLETNWIK